MEISLCIIAGNEHDHIGQMLNSFCESFDELSVVRAIGASKPDDTEQIARDWCNQNGKRFIFSDYLNDPSAANWMHVDNFASARNKSFSQSNGDWLIWADCDDVLSNAALLRKMLNDTPPDVVMLRFPYYVKQVETTTQRERAIRSQIFKSGRQWMWSVHENLLVMPGDKYNEHDQVTWIHSPTGKKAGGEKRNLRILTNALKDAPTNYYYCHQEHFHLRNTQQAIKFGELFIALPNANPGMKYRCLLNLAQLTDSKDAATTYALRAHHLYPKQKEALATLVECCFQEESVDRALHWSERLIQTKKLSVASRLWCSEQKWDGWHSLDLRIRALRYANKESSALNLEQQSYPVISLLHATRGRVSEAIKCRKRFYDAADVPSNIEHIFAIDTDDNDSQRWLKSFKQVQSSTPTCVSAWNNAAAAARGEVLIQLSDDWMPSPGWDTAVLNAIGARNGETEEFVVAVNDGTRTDALICMAICSRARYRSQGHLFAPEYESMFSDNEFTHRAYADGVVIDARHIVFEHLHPAFGKGQMDATYNRQNAPEKYKRGQATFNHRNPEAKIVDAV